MSPTATPTRRPESRSTGGSGRGPSIAQQRRRRERRIRRLKRALIALLVLALLAAAGWLVGFSPVLATEKVSVSGTKLLTVDGVRTTAAVPIGLPLARQDTTAIADRVATLAPVDTVSVDRRWPDTVEIKVVERKPVVAVKTGAGYLLVDHTGRAFETVPMLPTGVVQAGVDPADAALLTEAGIIASTVPAELRDEISTIEGGATDSFKVHLDSGPTVFWGSADQSALKGQVTLLLLKKKPKAIDVSAPHSPAVK
ncbi:cell division protein FtsQ/DivIB [Microlunatus ginsengisoli]|uniref:Cell division protein FtsQ n=1 Tax=Microlunatus ginsengisoli TaxID=363863 RepID=A0ABP7AAS8_9ACTN